MIQFEKDYAPALAGLVIGALAGLALAIRLRPAAAASARLSGWDARATVPLLMAAALAHLALLPAVELQRIVLFALYATALAATVGLGVAGYAIWRLGAVALPAA